MSEEEALEHKEAQLARRRESDARYRSANRVQLNWKQWKRRPACVFLISFLFCFVFNLEQ